MRTEAVWSRMGGVARARAARDYADWIGEHGFPDGMASCFARALRFREATIRKARGEDLERLLVRGLPRLSARERGTFAVQLYSSPRAELLDQVMDGLDGDLEALSALAEPEDVLLCLAAIELMAGGEASEELTRAAELVERRAEGRRARELEPPRTEARAAAVLDDDASGAASSSSETEVAIGPDSPQFTTLDRVLIRAMVSAVNGVEGALDADELRDLTEEVVALNDSRARSWFHLGYLAALRDDAPAEHGPAENRARRGWYLAGFLLGRLRKDPWEEVRARFDALSSRDQGVLLERDGTDGGHLLAQQFVPRLLEDGAVDEALPWIERYAVQVGPELMVAMVDWAKRSISSGRATSARRVLEAVLEALPDLARLWGELSPEFERLVRRRLAVSWRCEGRSAKAQELVERLLEECGPGEERARLLGEKALIAMGLRSLEGLALPEDLADRASFVQAVESVRPLLESSEEDGAPVPSVSVALALPTVADPGASAEAVEAAVRRLRATLDAMGHDAPGFWDRTGLDVRARFYLSVLELRSLDPSTAPGSVDRLHAVLESKEPLPFDLAHEAVSNALLCDAPRSGDVAHLALERWPKRILSKGELDELARRSAAFRREVSERLQRLVHELTVDERWRAWDQILRGSLRAAERDVETAARALDELERLGRDEGREAELLELLREPERWDPAWSLLDAKEAEVRILERLGRPEQARTVLHDLANLALSDRQPDALDLLDWISALGAPEEELEPLRRRAAGLLGLADGAGATAAPPGPGKAARVLVIGGNEVQERYEEDLRAFVRRHLPGCSVDFVFSGWSSNWGPLVKRIDESLSKADAIVLLRFVRTQLGRTVRRIASERDKPWIPCTGHGRASLERAISEAVRVAREHG